MRIGSAFISKKKLVIVLCLVIIVLPFILLFADKPKDTTPKLTISPTQIEKQISTETITPTKSTTTAEKWTTYTGDTFSFQYPPDWVAQKYDITGGGQAIIVKPQQLPEGINYPKMTVQTQKTSPTALDNKRGILEGFSMTRSEIMIGQDKAIQYRGTVPFKIYGNRTVQEPVQDTTILLEKNAVLYVIKFEYEGAEPNGALNKYFEDYLYGFHFN